MSDILGENRNSCCFYGRPQVKKLFLFLKLSYEKWAIEKWFYTQETSPITGLILNNHTLINNFALKSALDDFQKRQIKLKKYKIDLQKFLTKCEYDLNDLKKYSNNGYGEFYQIMFINAFCLFLIAIL